MNIIFLDIDGVLNNTLTFMYDNKSVDEHCIKLFIDTIKDIDCKIVISSSWRSIKKERFIQHIHISRSYELLQLLPHLHDDYCTPKFVCQNCIRGDEVQDWIDNHVNEVTKYICIDDDSDFLPHQPLLQTNRQIGFCLQDAKLLKAYFLGPKKPYSKESILNENRIQLSLIKRRNKLIQNL